MIIAQYYNFLRLGKQTYSNIMNNLMETSTYLGESLEKNDYFKLLDEELTLPILAIKLNVNKLKEMNMKNITVFGIFRRLRERRWSVPA